LKFTCQLTIHIYPAPSQLSRINRAIDNIVRDDIYGFRARGAIGLDEDCMAAERQEVTTDSGGRVIRYVITDTHKLRMSMVPRDRLLRMALSGIPQCNTRFRMESAYRQMYGERIKALMTRTLQCFNDDLQDFEKNFPEAYDQLTSDPSLSWSKDDLKELCNKENLRLTDVLGADAFCPPTRYSGAFAVAPLMVGVLGDGSVVESGLPFGAAAPSNVVCFRLSDLVSAQRGRKRKAVSVPRRSSAPEVRDFVCPCGCGVTGGCPCGCPTAEEHDRNSKVEAANKLRQDNMDGHCQLVRAVMGRYEGHKFSTSDLKDVVTRFNIRTRGGKLLQVNMSNLSRHCPRVNGGVHGYSRYSSIFCRDADGLFTLHPVFFTVNN
jgi:hypothetical protein